MAAHQVMMLSYLNKRITFIWVVEKSYQPEWESIAQSVEQRSTNLRVVFSIPTLVNNIFQSFHECVRRKKFFVRMLSNVFRCGICQKILKRKRDLVDHLNTHIGRKPYKCDTCQKCFATKSNKSSHEELHLGRIYTCTQCDQKFKSKKSAKRHENLKHSRSEVKPKCLICNKDFSRNDSLKRHKMLVHH